MIQYLLKDLIEAYRIRFNCGATARLYVPRESCDVCGGMVASWPTLDTPTCVVCGAVGDERTSVDGGNDTWSDVL